MLLYFVKITHMNHILYTFLSLASKRNNQAHSSPDVNPVDYDVCCSFQRILNTHSMASCVGNILTKNY